MRLEWNNIVSQKKKIAKNSYRAPHGKTSCTLTWGLCFYIYIYIYIDFHIKFLLLYIHISHLFLPSCPQQKRSILNTQYSLSSILFIFWWIFLLFQPLSFSLMVLFIIADLIFMSHLFLFLIICIDFYAYLGILVFQFMITSSFSLSHWFDLVWFLISCLAS